MGEFPFELSGEMPPPKHFSAHAPSFAEKNLKEVVVLMEDLQQKRFDSFLYSINLEIKEVERAILNRKEIKTPTDAAEQFELKGRHMALTFSKQLFTKIFIKK